MERFNVTSSAILTIRYNIPPGSNVAVISSNEPSKILMKHWGLIPKWAKNRSIGYNMINVRTETMFEKKTFSDLITSSRCMIPASGFYEWKIEKSARIPYYLTLDPVDIFAFAGIHSEWKDDQGDMVHSFAILTKEASTDVVDIHERMPVILRQEDEQKWLNSNTDNSEILEIISFTPKIKSYQVSKYVNNAKNESEKCIRKEASQASIDDFF